MSDHRKRILRWVYDLLFLFLTLLLGAAFIFQTVRIYHEGADAGIRAAEAARRDAVERGLDEAEIKLAVSKAKAKVQIYSRETVSEKFFEILPILTLWSVVALLGIVYSLTVPTEIEKRGKIPLYMLLERQSGRLPSAPAAGKEAEFNAAVSLRRKLIKRSKLTLAGIVGFCVIFAIFPIGYLADFSNFPNSNLNGEVVKAVLFSLPFVTGMLLLTVVYVVLRDCRIQKLAQAEKQIALYGDRSAVPSASEEGKQKKRILTLRILLFCVGMGLIIFGCFNQSVRDVFIKATNICTECIGLG